jgi:tetratricopeptide (TPR) repeat protein
MTAIDGGTLRQWRRAREWDVPRLARELRKAAGGDSMPAHDSLITMIWRWEREGMNTGRARSERYELLYRKLGFAEDDPAADAPPELAGTIDGDPIARDLEGVRVPGDGDEIAALELARRAAASDVGDITCERLEVAFDDLASAYPRTAPGDLLPRVRAHLGYVTRLLGGHPTFAQHRRLLVSGGWLSLLAATCLIDLRQDAPALASLRTAGQLAGDAGHAEITAWVLETRAWMAVTAGNYPEAVGLAQAAQAAAPRDGSAYIQATGQEGRAWARLGDTAQTTAALTRIETLTASLPAPDRPEHHYRYDPAKAEAYTATTLSWAGDPAAEQFTRDVLGHLESPAYGPPRRRRAAAARLDLAHALTARDKPDEAADLTLKVMTSGLLVPSNYWRAGEVNSEVKARGLPEAADLADAYRAILPAPVALPG